MKSINARGVKTVRVDILVVSYTKYLRELNSSELLSKHDGG